MRDRLEKIQELCAFAATNLKNILLPFMTYIFYKLLRNLHFWKMNQKNKELKVAKKDIEQLNDVTDNIYDMFWDVAIPRGTAAGKKLVRKT